MTAELTTVAADGQVTIPRDVLVALGIEGGARVEIEARDGEAVIRRHAPEALNEGSDMERRKRELRAISARYAAFRDGRSTDEIMKDIRGDDPFPP